MDRHFLVGISENKNSTYGVRFLTDFFTDKTNIKSTLFYCAPKPPAVFEDETGLDALNLQKRQERKIIENGKNALLGARQICIEKKMPQNNIFEKIQKLEFSKPMDIIVEGEKGAYDAVILGRRGLTFLEDFFEDSVSKAIFNEKFTFPLWLCRSSDPERKHVLLYLDGSPAAMQMADHVGFVLAEERNQHVHMLIHKDIKADTSLIDKYKAAITTNGVDKEKIKLLSHESGDTAKQILNLVEKNNYAAVALGRSGNERGILNRLFKGPVCSCLFRDLNDAALWLCP